MDEGTMSDGSTASELRHYAVFMAHADDAEFSCAGTVAKWVAEGHRVSYVLLTNSDKGSDDPAMTSERLAAIREEEQRAACAILGVADIVFLRYPDMTLDAKDPKLKMDLVRTMRQLRPDVVVCPDPSRWWHGYQYINHPDHRAAGEAVLHAAFPAAGNRLWHPELLAEGLEPIKLKEIWIIGGDEPNVFVDITPYMETKIAALRAHASQMGEWDPGPMVQQWAAEDGKRADPPVPFAEDFRRFTTSG
jgi:LmbE family N-acetylglucosaminyl deacetylase